MWKYEAQKHVRGARQHVYRRLATWQQKSLQCGRILQGFQRFGTQLGNMFQTEPFPSVSGPIQLHGIRTLPLFNFWQSLFRHQARWQICHYSTSTGLTSFAVLNDSSTSVSQIHWGVQSVSDLAPDPLLHLEKNPLLSRRTWKAHCPLQRSTALVVCSNLKEPMFMFSTMAQQGVVWCPYSVVEWKLSLWRSGWMVQSV